MLSGAKTALLALACGVVPVLTGCAPPPASAVTEVASRGIAFPDYPQGGWTYLSFSGAHGFQVNYLAANGRAWLWYPGNSAGVPEEWKLDTVAGQKAVCWRHPSNSYNPVTKQTGGPFACQSLALSQRSIVARVAGDPYGLSSGQIPYKRAKCDAPAEFAFDRNRFRC
ncbi:hypothetical protein [Leisingera thetidis]|uniref:hypothetical protein n=1 Tax=Leisingera thetidis TaxID=2930199 RepID=UPI0021F7E995|nr:hypothetical protein [Leisingera thetidis]